MSEASVSLTPRVRYGHETRQTLRERARSQSTSPDLRDELALLRELVTDTIEAYDLAVEEAGQKGYTSAQIQQVKITCGNMVAAAVERVERMAVSQSRVSSAKFLTMPDVNALIELFIGTVDSELATRAGNLRMAGMDPEGFMTDLAAKLRELQSAQIGAAMASTGPHGYASLAEARAAADAEAAMMDDTVPECTIQAHDSTGDTDIEDVA